MMAVADISLFFGRLHPVLVHLPIGFLVLLGLLELRACWRRSPTTAPETGFILAVIVLATGFTVLCGWLLSQGDGYDPRLLQLHLWTGVSTAVASALTGGLWWFKRLRLYRLSLLGTILLLTVAGHNGGALTHGRDYLFRYAPAPIRSWFSSPSANVAKPAGKFVTTVQPVLQKYCIACHGPEKSKGGLRLDSFAAMQAGGEKGPVLVPGDAGKSLLIRLLTLPPSDDDHMPPEGKPQPTTEEIAVLRAWIDSGATP
ncbi:MAG: c-type cytochrome domain-containing protein [Verrucomicrobiota bacterium]